MDSFKIIGGKPLKGEISPVPNKNAMLPAIASCILTNETVTLKNFSPTSDIKKMFEMLRLMGCKVDDSDYTNISVNCSEINSYKVDFELGSLIRASLLFAGPLLARFGIAEIPLPGGCVLGKRSIAAHVDAFEKCGIQVKFFDDFVRFSAPKDHNEKYKVWMVEASVTATENLVMYCAGTKSTFEIVEAASEPHVTQLLDSLKDMGAEIDGTESNRLTIRGNNVLHGVTFWPDPDPIDISGLICATAVTKGIVTLKNSNNYKTVGGINQFFRKFGLKITQSENDLIIDATGELFLDPVNSGFPLAADNMPKIVPRPWPGFPVDALPSVVTMCCKNKGKILIQNWMYETGLDYVNILNEIGANIFVCDPQRVVVYGPIKFKGGRIKAPSIIQATYALLLAGISDETITYIDGIEALKRRYSNIAADFNSLGADIEELS